MSKKQQKKVIESVNNLISIRNFLMTAIESPKMVSNDKRTAVNSLITKIDYTIVNNLLTKNFEEQLDSLIIQNTEVENKDESI